MLLYQSSPILNLSISLIFTIKFFLKATASYTRITFYAPEFKPYSQHTFQIEFNSHMTWKLFTTLLKELGIQDPLQVLEQNSYQLSSDINPTHIQTANYSFDLNSRNSTHNNNIPSRTKLPNPL